MRLPTYADHRRFCEVDGWQDKDARSKKTKGDHHRYVKVLPDGKPLFTRVSHGSGQYRSPSFWGMILREQLGVTEDQFWDAVEKGVVPTRASAEPKPPGDEPLPMELVTQLRYAVGLSIHEIGSMTLDEAEIALRQWEESLEEEESEESEDEEQEQEDHGGLST